MARIPKDKIKKLPDWAQKLIDTQARIIAEYQKEVIRWRRDSIRRGKEQAESIRLGKEQEQIIADYAQQTAQHRRERSARKMAQAGVKTPLQVQEERITQLEVRARHAEAKAKTAGELSDRVTTELSRNRAELSRHKTAIGETWKPTNGNVLRIVDLDTSHLRNIIQGGFADGNRDVVQSINAELKRRRLSAEWRVKQGNENDDRALKGVPDTSDLKRVKRRPFRSSLMAALGRRKQGRGRRELDA